MPYDQYHNWSLPAGRGAHPPLPGSDIKKRVLQDLGLPADDIDMLEILDSFEAWVMRSYQAEIAEMMANQMAVQARSFIQAGILGQFPPVTPVLRGRPSQQP